MQIKYLVGRVAEDFEHFLLGSGIWRYLPFKKGSNLIYDLRWFSNDSIQTVVDVGANVGQSALLYNSVFKKARILSFEPVSATFQKLKERVRSKSRIEVYPFAFGENEGTLNIVLQEDSELNSLVSNSEDSASKAFETIQVRTLDNFCHQEKIESIDLLKIDVEGFELQVLNGAKRLIESNKVNFILVEAGWIKSDQLKTNFNLLDDYLTSKGYMMSSIYETFRWGPRKAYAGFSNVLFVRRSYFEN